MEEQNEFYSWTVNFFTKVFGNQQGRGGPQIEYVCSGVWKIESGEREPSYQMVAFIALTFNTSIEYLYGRTDNKEGTVLTISSNTEPDLFFLIQSARNDKDLLDRLLAYTKK